MNVHDTRIDRIDKRVSNIIESIPICNSSKMKNPEAALLPRGRVGLRHPAGHPVGRRPRARPPGTQFN